MGPRRGPSSGTPSRSSSAAREGMELQVPPRAAAAGGTEVRRLPLSRAASRSWTSGGSAGQVAALWAFGVDGTGSLHDNLFTDLTGGVGGAGRLSAGWGGNATGVLAVGDGSPYNLTLVQRNTISFLTGGAGGIGTLAGGTGGGVSGFAAIHVRVGSDSNTTNTLTGGRGGNAFIIGNAAGRGGDCPAFIPALAPHP